MNLYAWPGYQNMESFDPESLAVITYIKIAQAPMNYNFSLTPWYCPQYSLPLLKHSLNVSTNIKEIIPYFRKENYGIEYNLSDEDMAQLNILSMNIHQELIPAVQYLMWYDEHNYCNVTRPVLGKIIGLPMCLFIPNIVRKRMIASVASTRLSFLTLHKFQASQESMKSVLYDAGKRCLTSLEYMLTGEAPGFFISHKPTYIEAVLYGYLWPVLNLGYEADSLVSHLRQCPKLMDLLSGIHRRYYPHLSAVVPGHGPDNGDPNRGLDAGGGVLARGRSYVRGNWAQIRNSCVFLVAVTGLMVWYTRHARRIK